MKNKQIKYYSVKWIEGSLSDEELLLFNEYLHSHPSVQKDLEIQKNMHEILSKETQQEPIIPDALRGRVFHSIDHYKYVNSKNKNIIQSTMNNRSSKRQWVVAYTFILGMIMGIVLMMLNGDKEPDLMNLSGSMLKNSVCFPTQYHNDKADVDIETCYNNDILSLTLELSSIEEISTRIAFPSSAFEVYAVKFISGNEYSSSQTGYNSVVIDTKGEQNVVIFLKNKTNISQKIDVSVSDQFVQLFSDQLLIEN